MSVAWSGGCEWASLIRVERLSLGFSLERNNEKKCLWCFLILKRLSIERRMLTDALALAKHQ